MARRKKKLSNCAWSAAAVSAGLLLSAPAQRVAAQAPTAGSASLLEEVVVTARRREESLQDLPLSVAAITADAMQAQGIQNLDQVGEFVPNLAFFTGDRRHVKAIYIRGIGNDSPVTIRPSGTGLYLDGQYLPNNLGQMMSTVEIERIEVMRGPQGTLFGKNTTGGAVNIVTAKPTQEFEADVMMRIGSFGEQDVKAMVNVPMGDTVAGRFSVVQEQMDGFWTNNFFGGDTAAQDMNGFSAALRFTPNDNWTIDVAARANYQDDDDAPVQCAPAPNQAAYDTMVAEYGAAALANFSPVVNGIGSWGAGTPNSTTSVGHIDAFYPGATLDFWNECLTMSQQGPYVTAQGKDTYLDLSNEFANANIVWDSAGQIGAFDNLNVRTILAKQKTDLQYLSDRDGTPFQIDTWGLTDPRGQRREVNTVEFIVTMDVNDRMAITAGYHYFDDEIQAGQRSPNGCLATFARNFMIGGDATNDFAVNPNTLADPSMALRIPCEDDGGERFDFMSDTQVPSLNGTGRDGYEVNDSDAVYAHLTYELSDLWTLDVGARWTEEQRIFHQLEWGSEPGSCSHSQPGDPPPTALCDNDLVLSYSSWAETGFYNNSELKFSETTPMVSFSRSLEGGDTLDDGMVYFSYSEGFLTGSFNDELNTTLVPQAAPLLTYQPESVKNYEVGFKGTFADGRMRLSTAAFFMDYRDKHETVDIDNSDGRFGADPDINVTTNASTVDIYGIEVELRAQPWDGGFLTVDFGWLDNEYGEFPAFDPDTGATIDRSNLTIADYSPEFTLNASVEHTFQLANGASITPMLGMYWQDEYDFITEIDRSGPNSVCFQDAYAKFRARVTYTPASENWQASLSGSNIADERYFERCGNARAGMFEYRFGMPDAWRMEFQYFWGGN